MELGRVDLGERGLAGGFLDERDAGAGVLCADGLAVPEQGGADFLDLVLLGFLGRRGGIAEVEGLLGRRGFRGSRGFLRGGGLGRRLGQAVQEKLVELLAGHLRVEGQAHLVGQGFHGGALLGGVTVHHLFLQRVPIGGGGGHFRGGCRAGGLHGFRGLRRHVAHQPFLGSDAVQHGVVLFGLLFQGHGNAFENGFKTHSDIPLIWLNYRGDDLLLAGYRFRHPGVQGAVEADVLHEDSTILADAVDTVFGLGHHARDPILLHHHGYACGGEREPHARRLKISNEHPHSRVVLESLHGLVPGLHRGVPGDRNRLDPDQFQNPRDDFLVVGKHHDFGFLLQDVLDVRDRRADLGQPEESTRLCQIAHSRRFDPVMHEDGRVLVLDLQSVPDLPIRRQEDRLPNLLRQLGQHVPL